MAAPVFALAVLGMVLTLATFWHLPTVRACLTPLDKKMLRQVIDAVERGVTMGSFGGGRVSGTTDIGGGTLWAAGTPRVSFEMCGSTVDMDGARSTIVGTSLSRGSLTFQQVTCSVPVRRRGASGAKSRWGEFDKVATVWRGAVEYKVILQPCSGTLRGGEITGMLGPVGSGKKALLHTLAGDLKDMDADAVVRGSVFTLGSGSRDSKINVGLVNGQSETLKSMTVAEAMVYTALLKSKPGTELTLIKQRILMASEELQVTPLMSRFVSGGKGLDGAERRRLMIACELQLDPDILLVEEPTAGLSAPDATNVIKALRQVSRFGRAVLVSISQPSNDLLASLDNTMLIGRGHMVFNGSTSDAHRFFANAGCPAPKPSAFPQHAMKVLSRPETLTKLIEAAGRSEPPLQGVALMPALSFKVVDQSIRRRRADQEPTSKMTTSCPYTSVPGVPDNAEGVCNERVPKLSPRVAGAKVAVRGSTSRWPSGGDGVVQRRGSQYSQGQTDVAEESDPSYTKYDGLDHCAHMRDISNASSRSSPVAEFEWNNGLAWQASRKSEDSASDLSDLPLDFSGAAGHTDDGRREARLCSALEMHTPWVRGVARGDSGAVSVNKSPWPSSSTSPPVHQTASRFEELPAAVSPRDEPDEQGMQHSAIRFHRVITTPQLPVDDSSFDDDACRVQLDCQTSGDLIELVNVKSSKNEPLGRRNTLVDVSGIPEAAGPSQAGDNLEDSAKFAWRPTRKFPGRGRSMNPGVGLQPSSPLKIGQGPFGRPPMNPRGSFSQKRVLGAGESSSQAEAPLAVAPKAEACERVAPVHRSDTAMPMLGNQASSRCLESVERNDRHLKEPPVRQSLSLEAALLFWRGLNHMYRELTMFIAHSLAALGFGALLGLVFLDLDAVDTDELRSHSTAFFWAMAALSISAVASACGVSAERALAVHEVRSSHYRTINYVLVHAVLSFLILRFIPVCIFSGVFVSMAELDTWTEFSWATAMRIILVVGGLTTFWGTMSGMVNMALSCKSKRGVKILVVVGIVLYGPLVSGFLIHKDNIPWLLSYIHYVSPFSVTFEALMISEFSSVYVDTGRQVTIETSDGLVSTLEEDTFRAMGLDEDNLALDSGLAVLFYAFVVVLTAVGMWAKSKRPHTLSTRRICCG